MTNFMTRQLRVGDRVTATGTVRADRGKVTDVMFDGHDFPYLMVTDSLTLIAPAEPPVGSVVVMEGRAYAHEQDSEGSYWVVVGERPAEVLNWATLSSGEVIFTPGGDA